MQFYAIRELHHMPRFTSWCGTRRTEDWHRRFPVLSGHCGRLRYLYIRSTIYRDGVRFAEVSLGYPRDWQQGQGGGPISGKFCLARSMP
jgi:hypothetical protein